MLGEHKNKLSAVTLVPSTGGVFEIKLNNELIFSKKETDRFPNEDEAEDAIRQRL